MELNLKIQNILDVDPNNKKQLSLTHFFDVEDPELSKKRGKLFTVVSLESNEHFESQPALKIFLDNIRDSYYRNTDETPLNAIEKALSRAYQVLLSIKDKDLEQNSNIEVSFCTALIWNKVLYVSYIGKPAAYLIRGSGVRNIAGTPSTSGEIWTSSSILDLEDVIVIGTEKFASTFPPQEIIGALNEIPQLVAEHPDKNLIAATLIKIAGSTGKESPGSGNSMLTKLYMKGSLPDKIGKVKESLFRVPRLSEKFNIYQRKKTAPVSSISGLISSNQNIERSNTETAKRLSNRKKNMRPVKFTIGLATIVFLTFTGYYLLQKRSQQIELQASVTNGHRIVQDPEAESEIVNTPEVNDLHPVLLDPKSLSSELSIYALSGRATEAILFDKAQGTLYEFNPEKSEMKSVMSNIDSFEYLECDDKLCYVYANKVLHVVNTKTPDKVDKYLLEGINNVVDVYPYLNKAYILTTNNIHSLPLQSETAEVWIKSGTLNFPTAITVDSNVYVLNNKTVDKYYGGNKTTSYDLSEHLKSPAHMEMDNQNIYILDKETKEVIVFGKTNMSLVKRIKLAEDQDIDTPEKFALLKSTSKTEIIFLKGGKLYKSPN